MTLTETSDFFFSSPKVEYIDNLTIISILPVIIIIIIIILSNSAQASTKYFNPPQCLGIKFDVFGSWLFCEPTSPQHTLQ